MDKVDDTEYGVLLDSRSSRPTTDRDVPGEYGRTVHHSFNSGSKSNCLVVKLATIASTSATKAGVVSERDLLCWRGTKSVPRPRDARLTCKQLLQTVNVAGLYPDPKTFVDKPTEKPSQQVLSNFRNVTNSSSLNVGSIVNFVDTDFRGEGLELEPVALANFNAQPTFLNNVTDPLLKGWSQVVHGYWTQLIRATNRSALCPTGSSGGPCESSLIPLNHTFVVPGGRFREQCTLLQFHVSLIRSELTLFLRL